MDSTEINFNDDERRSERATAIALFFTNAKAPVPTSAINERFYPDYKEDNQRKTFKRDRDLLLSSSGFKIREAGSRPRPGGGTEKLWEVDEEATFAQGVELGALVAITLDVACQPLLEDHTFILGEALRRALAKIDRTYGDAEQAIETNAPQIDATAIEIQGCMEEHFVANLRYRNAAGIESERLFAPFGIYSFRGQVYVVGDLLDEERPRRTLLLGRIQAIERTTQHYEVPEDFDIRDYPKLPFQIGDTQVEGLFLVPDEFEGDLRHDSLGKGSFEREATENEETGRLTWRVDISSIDDAARWGVAHGIRPLAPETLVEAWVRCLKGVIEHG